MPEQAPAGWYDDPERRPGVKRYWDGQNWTDRFEPPRTPDSTSVERIERRYVSLRTIAAVFYVLGWITAVLGTVAVIALAIAASEAEDTTTTVFGESSGDSGASVVAILVGGGLGVFIYSLVFFAAAGFIRLMISVEESTRRTAEAVERLNGASSGDPVT